jgi:putative transposon-encoded protein
MMTQKMRIEIEAFQAIDKEVKAFGSTSHVLLPKGWRGKKVKVLLLEELD